MNSIKIIIAVLFCSLTFSCASYDRIYNRMDKLKITDNNLSIMNGTYEMFAVSEYNTERGKKISIEPTGNKYISFYKQITNDGYSIDTSAKYSFVLNSSRAYISFQFFKNNIAYDTIIIKARISKNGFYYLDNSKITCHGIPYVFGGCQQTKTRLGLSKNGDLILNKAFENSGALLLFFWAGQEYNTCYIFKKRL